MASTMFMMSCTAISHSIPSTKFCTSASPRQPLKGLLLKLSSSEWRGGFSRVVLERASPIHNPRQRFEPVTTVAAKGYKMKTHKAISYCSFVVATVMVGNSLGLQRGFIIFRWASDNASAKRFRVTGSGKIVRRRAGKQHLLAKKNTKRKHRLSLMTYVDRSDYDNVIGALPYLKVKRKVV